MAELKDPTDGPRSGSRMSPWFDCPALRFSLEVTAILTSVFTVAQLSSVDDF